MGHSDEDVDRCLNVGCGTGKGNQDRGKMGR